MPGFGCVLDPEGDALLHNTFRRNGYFGNPSNSDYGQITLFGNEPQNCFADNRAPDGSALAGLEQTQRACGVTTTNTGGGLFPQVLCDCTVWLSADRLLEDCPGTSRTWLPSDGARS